VTNAATVAAIPQQEILERPLHVNSRVEESNQPLPNTIVERRSEEIQNQSEEYELVDESNMQIPMIGSN
jgi:hypothetical protein